MDRLTTSQADQNGLAPKPWLKLQSLSRVSKPWLNWLNCQLIILFLNSIPKLL
ncbi:20661_t:CDS:1, partial [Dentiscutata erythropus]